MNNKFDELSRGLAQFVTRRAALKKFSIGLAGAALAIGLCVTERAGAGSFRSTGAMIVARDSSTATLLPNGKVLIAGGWNESGAVLTSAELYDPATGTWSATGPMALGRAGHTATLLSNGLVLVAGGDGDTTYLATAEIYDPASSNWTTTGSMTVGRVAHTATLLQDGKVLIAGGFSQSGSQISAEAYDPTTGTWTETDSLNLPRYAHTATLLGNGRVLVAGGLDGFTSELYDPATETWSWTGLMDFRTRHRDNTATLLQSQKVLVAGAVYMGLVGHMTSPSAELYDSAAGLWTNAPAMNTPRYAHTATLLPDGRVLVVGGVSDPDTLSAAELYDSASGTWTAAGSMADGRSLHTATLLTNGLVLIAGGYNGVNDLSSAEVYDPSSGSIPQLTTLNSATVLANGFFRFSFTNTPGAHFRVQATPALEFPIGNWTILDGVSEISPGQFQFTDTQATNFSKRFYLLRSP